MKQLWHALFGHPWTIPSPYEWLTESQRNIRLFKTEYVMQYTAECPCGAEQRRYSGWRD